MVEAFKRQQQILKECEKENEIAHRRYDQLIKAGAIISMQGKVVGPYTTRTSYWMSNGEFITIVTPSSLAWAYSHPIFRV